MKALWNVQRMVFSSRTTQLIALLLCFIQCFLEKHKRKTWRERFVIAVLYLARNLRTFHTAWFMTQKETWPWFTSTTLKDHESWQIFGRKLLMQIDTKIIFFQASATFAPVPKKPFAWFVTLSRTYLSPGWLLTSKLYVDVWWRFFLICCSLDSAHFPHATVNTNCKVSKAKKTLFRCLS